MSVLPNIMPADPRAPEGVRHWPTAVRYGLIGRIFLTIDHAMKVSRERQQLLHLDAKLLRDIGLTRDEAVRQSRRRFLDCDAPRLEISNIFSQPELM